MHKTKIVTTFLINSGKILTVPSTQSKCGIEYSLKLIKRQNLYDIRFKIMDYI